MAVRFYLTRVGPEFTVTAGNPPATFVLSQTVVGTPGPNKLSTADTAVGTITTETAPLAAGTRVLLNHPGTPRTLRDCLVADLLAGAGGDAYLANDQTFTGQNTFAPPTGETGVTFAPATVSEQVLKILPRDLTESAPFGVGVGEYGPPDTAAGTRNYCAFLGHNVGASGSPLDLNFAYSAWAFEQRYASPVTATVDLIETHLYHRVPGGGRQMNRLFTAATSCHASTLGNCSLGLNVDSVYLAVAGKVAGEAEPSQYQQMSKGLHRWTKAADALTTPTADLLLTQDTQSGSNPYAGGYVPANKLISTYGDVHLGCAVTSHKVVLNHVAWVNNSEFNLAVPLRPAGGVVGNLSLAGGLFLQSTSGMYLYSAATERGYLYLDGEDLILRHRGDYAGANPGGNLWIKADPTQSGTVYLAPNSAVSPLVTLYGNGKVVIDGQNYNGVGGGFSRLTVKASADQAYPVLAVTSSADAFLSGFSAGGYPVTAVNAAPADGAIAAGECFLWFDKTNGAAKLKIKAKQADGTVRTGEVALT